MTAALTLDVHLEGVDGPVGQLSRDADGASAFRYLRDDLPHPVSLSLPVRDAPFDDVATRGFFSNLLFENPMRDQVRDAHGIAEGDFVGLLEHLGADCPGAISVRPVGAGPGKAPGRLDRDYDAVDDAALAEIVASLALRRRLPDGMGDPSPLAGVQGKLALARLPDGRMALPKPGSGAPTTHILKVPRAGEEALVLREATAMALMARLVAHPVAETAAVEHGGRPALLVRRYDRHVDDRGIARIHQEDFCQALGLPALLKYERYGTGARVFDAAAIGRVLGALAAPGPARLSLFEIALARLALGDTDGHGKNYAVLHGAGGPGLAPIYDVVPTLLDDCRHDMPFRIGRALMADDIAQDDVAAFLAALGVRRVTAAVLNRGRSVLTRLLAILRDEQATLPKRVFDAAAQQTRWLLPALGMDAAVPDFDLVPVNRVEAWDNPEPARAS